MKYEVLYEAEPAWLVGERGEDAYARRDARPFSVHGPEQLYPGMHRNRITSIRKVEDVESGKLPSLRHMSDKWRPVVVLDLDEAGFQGAASRTMKVAGDRLAPVTFDDRFGAVAVKLRERHPDPEAWEREETAAREAAEKANADALAAHARATEEHKALCATWGREAVAAMHAPGLELPDLPEPPKPLTLVAVPESSFDRTASELAATLPPTITHTGTGLYAVKVTPTHLDRTQSGAPVGQAINLTAGGLGVLDAYKGGYIYNATRAELRAIVSHTDAQAVLEGVLTNWLNTDDLDIYDSWSTGGAVAAQLLTDQGTGNFSSSQYCRLFAGTHDGFAFSVTLKPLSCYRLIVEGDPAAAREDVIINGAVAAGALTTPNSSWIRHLTLVANQGWSLTAGLYCVIDDCYIRGDTSGTSYRALVQGIVYGLIRDTLFRLDVAGSNCRGAIRDCTGSIVQSCQFLCDAPGYPGPVIGIYGGSNNPTIIEGSTFRGWYSLSYVNVPSAGMRMSHCTFYDCANGLNIGSVGVYSTSIPALFELRNNIFKDVPYPIRIAQTGVWPEETAESALCVAVLMRNNCFHGYTNFAYDGTTAKTYEEFAALGLVDAEGDIFTDPLLADPATGDFSLGNLSPCLHAGAGAGVATGINGVVFDRHHPDIGPWSSNIWNRPGAPVILSVGDTGTGTSAILLLMADDGADVLSVYHSKATFADWTLFGTTRTGTGFLTVTGLTPGWHQFICVATRFGERSPPSDPLSGTVLSLTPPTASGAVSLPLENVRDLLANSATFIALVGAADPGDAKTCIHYPAVAGASWTRPRAVIAHVSPAPRHALVGRGGGNGFSEEGDAEIAIEADVGASYQAAGSEEEAFLEFANTLGAIVTEMEALAGTAGYLDATAFEVAAVERCSTGKAAVGEHWYRGEITLRWGG